MVNLYFALLVGRYSAISRSVTLNLSHRTAQFENG